MLRKNIQDPRKTPIQWPKQDKPPSFSQLEEMKGQANQNLGRSIELPFGIHVLFAQKSKGAPEVQWMLYRNEGDKSHLEWEYSQQDLHILHTTIVAQFPDADWSGGGDRLSASGKKPGASAEPAPAAPAPPSRPAGAPITPAGPPGGAPMPLLPPMLNQGGGMMPMMPGMPGAMPGMPGATPGMPGAMPGMPGAMPGMPGMPGAMPGMQPGMQPMPGMPGSMPQAQAPAVPPEQAAFQNILQGQPGMPGSMSPAPNPQAMPQAMPGQMPSADQMQTGQQWAQPAPQQAAPPAGQWIMSADQPQPASQWSTPTPAPAAAPAPLALTPVSPEQASQWGPAPTENAPVPDPGFSQWSQPEPAAAATPDPGFSQQWSQPSASLPTQASQWTDQSAAPESAAQAAAAPIPSSTWSQPMPADQAAQWSTGSNSQEPQLQSGQWTQPSVPDSAPQLQSGQWSQPTADSSQASGQWSQPSAEQQQSGQWSQTAVDEQQQPEPANDGAGKRPTMEGALNKMQVPTLIEVVAVGKGTGRLEIIGASDVGQMYFKDGELLHALTRSMEGDMAVLDLIAWEGSYKFVPDEETDHRTVSKQIDALMVEATTLFDQLTSMEVEGLTMQSLIQRTSHGITESEFEQAVGQGVQANMQYQKMFYQAVDNQSSLEEVLRRSPLAKRDWVPVLFNLSKCGLVTFEHGDGAAAAPQATPMESEPAAPVAESTPAAPMPIDWNKVRELEQSMKRHDTGLYSFYAFLLTLEKEFDRFDRFNRPLSIVIIEVDMINTGEPKPVDVEGIKRIAARIEKLKRKTDLLAHFEDHGLALLLPETPAASTRNVVTILIEALYATNMVEGVSNDALKLHIGSAGVPEDCKDIDELIKLARPDKSSNKLAAS